MNRREDVDQIVNSPKVQVQDISEMREDNRAMITHDLRTALSGITGGLAQIEVSRLDNDQRQLVAQMQLSGRHLAELLETAFDEGAFEGNDLPINPEPVDLASLLDEVGSLWQRRATEKGLKFSIKSEPGCPKTIFVDRSAFHRLIGNLLGNAIKFTSQGSVSVVAQSADNGEMSLVIRDTGPGISAEAMKTIFQMYGRPGSSDVPGSGIGLHVAKVIAQKLGGQISAANHVAGGAEVSVLIPVPANMRDPDEVAPSPPPTAKGLPDLSRLRILLAEDNSTNQLVVTQMLRAMKADPVLASDGVEALARFEEGEFDVALLDIEMPRISGLDVIRRIRSRTDHKSSVRLVALTAYAMKEHRERIFDAGADGLIPKPLTSIEDLGNQILAYVGQAAQNKAASADAADVQVRDDNGGLGAIDSEIFNALSEAIGTESMDELKRKVAEDMETVSTGVSQGIKGGDAERIRFNTHILISVAGVIGATRLQAIAERLNSLAQHPGHPEMDALAEQCIAGISGVLNTLRAEPS